MKPFHFIISALLISIIFTQCSDGDSNTGRINVLLTDAPFPTDLVDEANVTITKIEARQSGSEEEESSFVTLYEGEGSSPINLLDLTNGVTANIVDAEVPVGSYDLVRVYVTEASVLLKDGNSYDLKVPSGAQTGIKIFVKPAIEVAGGLTADLILDFDVSRSFVPRGPLNSPNGFIFKPVIKASNESVAGSLGGIITAIDPDTQEVLPADGATVSVYAADTFNTSTVADLEGNYGILGLDAGLYDITAEYDGFDAVTVEDVEIVVANRTTQDIQLGN